ncbi:centrosomal protein CCDC61 isoform X2 [Calonectris borealis]|uniref:centrosomal protein CCDC61 isoform X2 n=1 Tax=Calonectris borealis TaxID=1323832 RepID=UPI003F4C9CF8
MGEPRYLQADYAFRHGGHAVRLTLSRSALEVEVEAHLTADQWRGEFDAAFIEDLTHKTGNFKQFGIFCSMLESALMQRVRQPGAPHLRRPGDPAQPESGGHRPAPRVRRVPAQRQALPHPRLLRRVRQDPLPAAAALRRKAGSCRASPAGAGAEGGTGAAPGSARGRSPRRRNPPPAGRAAAGAGGEAGGGGGAAARTGWRDGGGGDGAAANGAAFGGRTATGESPASARAPAAGRRGPRPPRFDPTAFVRDRQRRQKEVELKNQRRGAAFGSASPARSRGRSSSAESFWSRRSAASSGSEADERSESLPPRGRRVTRTRRPLSASSCNGPGAAPRPAAGHKPPAGSATSKRPGKENCYEEPSAELAEIDARLRALQEYMESLDTRT